MFWSPTPTPPVRSGRWWAARFIVPQAAPLSSLAYSVAWTRAARQGGQGVRHFRGRRILAGRQGRVYRQRRQCRQGHQPGDAGRRSPQPDADVRRAERSATRSIPTRTRRFSLRDSPTTPPAKQFSVNYPGGRRHLHGRCAFGHRRPLEPTSPSSPRSPATRSASPTPSPARPSASTAAATIRSRSSFPYRSQFFIDASERHHLLRRYRRQQRSRRFSICRRRRTTRSPRRTATPI